MEIPKAGDVVVANTSRFGAATVKILKIGAEWVDVEIVKGKLIGMTDEWWPGDKKTLRISHCIFFPASNGLN